MSGLQAVQNNWTEIIDRLLADKRLLANGRVTLKNCTSSKGNKYSAVFSLEDTGKYVNLKFEEFVGKK